MRPQSNGSAIVAIGGFNPRIFEPLWFAQQELVPEAETAEAGAQMVDRQFARLELPWAVVTVVPERLDVRSTGETAQPAQILDLVIGIFRVLPHTTVEHLGINHWAHFSVASEEVWHQLGHELAPKSLWEEVLYEPGMLSLSMRGQRTDGHEGSVNVSVQPSLIIHPGIYINVNDDFIIKPDLPEPAARTADVLEDVWHGAIAQAERIQEAVLSRAGS
jgi:hypothetical protein